MREILKITIDPGVNGAMVWQRPSGPVTAVKRPETVAEKIELAYSVFDLADVMGWECRCLIEYQCAGSFHGAKMGAKSVWTLSGDYHTWLTTLLVARLATREVRPQKWQKPIAGLPREYSARKKALKAYAQMNFPQLNVINATADALAMLTVFDTVWLT
jgi:hypothetical protein